jgi:hypothetical protein
LILVEKEVTISPGCAYGPGFMRCCPGNSRVCLKIACSNLHVLGMGRPFGRKNAKAGGYDGRVEEE